MHKYTDLEVYRQALGFTVDVRRAMREFPREERFSFGGQLNRALDSIVLKIAEGAGCDSNKEFARFLTVSIRSAFECNACLDIASVNNLLQPTQIQNLHTKADRLIAMLYGLQKHLRNNV